MTITGRTILTALQKTYQHDGDFDQRFHGFAASLLSTMFNVSIAWAAINKGGIFEAYFYNKESAEKVRDGLGWICEIKEMDSGDFRLLMNV
jgi:hypothetical protein